MNTALDNIRNRVDAFGVGEPDITLSGNTIEIQIPGLSDSKIQQQPADTYCITDPKGATYGYSWEGGAMVMGISRMDLMEKKGLKIPKTFAELQNAVAEINGTDGVSGIVSWLLHNWNLPPYIQGFGGKTTGLAIVHQGLRHRDALGPAG